MGKCEMELFEIITTVDSHDCALKLANGLVSCSLAACVQIDGPFTSVYRWKGKVESSLEFRMTIKSSIERKTAVVDWLKENHSYDLPQIVMRRVAASREYAEWVESECKPVDH